jgi:hypothetical protein
MTEDLKVQSVVKLTGDSEQPGVVSILKVSSSHPY